jgi:ferredoxin/DNA-binding MarR family transcriptional regulator
MGRGEAMMSSTAVKEIAPKRKRMMDMILALGGLKEEAAIPLSRVNEEISNLKTEIEPLIADILGFPAAYFERFYEIAKKTALSRQVMDKGVLTESLTSLEKAINLETSDGLIGLHDALRKVLDSMASREKPSKTATIDIGEILGKLPETTSAIVKVIDDFDEASRAEQEKARKELDALTTSFHEIVSDQTASADDQLEKLQKLGTATRYGPFLRVAAQLKRAKRDERIDDDRFSSLIKDNLVVELRRGIILFALNRMGSKTAIQLAELTGIASQDIQQAMVSMISRSEIEMVGLDDDAPVFARVLGKASDITLILKKVVQQLRGVTKNLNMNTENSPDSSLKDLERAYRRLQILGEYDETALAVPMKTLSEISEKAVEAAIGSQGSEEAEDLRLLVSAGLEAFARFRLKIALEKGPSLVSGTNVYGEHLDPERYKLLMDSYLDNELERGTMLIVIREIGAMTAKDLAERTGIPQDRVLQHLLRMKHDELLVMAGEDHGYILYDVPRTLNEAEIAVQTVSSLALQTSEAKRELQEIIADLKPQTIGNLTNALEVFSRARDKMDKIEIDGAVVAKDMLTQIEDKIKSAVAMGYRTRARIPSTRAKVTIEDLMDVDVPSVLDEYREMMGYAPLLGFGTIEWDQAKCLGCKSCQNSCPEHAIELRPFIDVPKFFEFTEEEIERLPVNKATFYKTVRNLAIEKPATKIELDSEKPGFGTVEVDLWLCVGCRTCVRRCPGPEDGALELELKWSLPEVVRHITTGE